ncbi:MAG: transcriptional regulator, XRE family [uncultured bacterium]|nr:MAG: transcriptional regulator, XRE family [uncultured bacterium]
MVKFTTKKIDSLTLGERMKKLRDERRLSLSEVSKGTKIQAKYLGYLEDGTYLKLPADVYVKGFLKSYAIFMGLNECSLIKQFEREKGIHKNIKKVVDDDHPKKIINFSSIVITPKIIIVSLVLIVFIAGFGYLYAEVNNFVSKPRLVIMTPTDGATVSGSSTHVTGLAEKDAVVFINEQPVLVSENGEFSQDVGLKNGVNTINVKARSKFDKESNQAVTINADFENKVGEMQTGVAQQQNSEGEKAFSDPISLELYVNPNPSWMSVEADGNLVYSGVLLPGSIQKFEAKEKVSITSGKGNETYIKINGKDMGILSEESGVVRDIMYNAKGKIENKN